MGNEELKLILATIISIMSYFFVRDHNAITECRLLFPQLMSKLKILNERGHSFFLPPDTLADAEDIIIKLSAQEKKLLICNKSLRLKLETSRDLLSKKKTIGSVGANLANNSINVISRLPLIWGVRRAPNHENFDPNQIQLYLDQGLPKRIIGALKKNRPSK